MAAAGDHRAGSAPGERRLRWDTGGATSTLDICPFPLPPPLRDRPTISGAWMIALRTTAHARVAAIRLACTWAPDAHWDTDEGPETGEWVDAHRWSGGTVTLSLGTSDLEAIFNASAPGRPLPPRWRDVLVGVPPDGRGLLVVDETGVRIDGPSLQPGEVAQLHVLVAWGPRGADDAATWMAVGATPEEVALALPPIDARGAGPGV